MSKDKCLILRGFINGDLTLLISGDKVLAICEGTLIKLLHRSQFQGTEAPARCRHSDTCHTGTLTGRGQGVLHVTEAAGC